MRCVVQGQQKMILSLGYFHGKMLEFFFGYEIVHCGFLLTEGVSDILFGVCHQNIDFPPYIPKLLPVFFHFLPSNLALKNSRPPFSCNKKSSHIHTTINFKKKETKCFSKASEVTSDAAETSEFFSSVQSSVPKSCEALAFNLQGGAAAMGQSSDPQLLRNILRTLSTDMNKMWGFWLGGDSVMVVFFVFNFSMVVLDVESLYRVLVFLMI